MEQAFVVVFLWAVFGGTHIGLGIGPIRGRLVARLGEFGFTVLFYLVASASFTALIAYYAANRFDGASGLPVGSLPALRWMLMVVAGSGLALIAPALVAYPRLPAALFGQPIGAPRGIERITRHPFFAGAALFAIAHTLLASRLVGTVFFAGLALLSVVGAWHQDVKLAARRGRPYAEYLRATSAIPFAAILSGRQSLVWSELPVPALALGVVTALALRTWHAAIFAHGGVWIIVVFVVGGLIAGLSAWRRSHRLGALAGVSTASTQAQMRSAATTGGTSSNPLADAQHLKGAS